MNLMMRALIAENRDQRGATGQGRPGLHKFLGGAVLESDAAQQVALGSRGQIGAWSLVSPAYVDQRLRAPASIVTPPSGGGGGGGGGGGTRPRPNLRPY